MRGRKRHRKKALKGDRRRLRRAMKRHLNNRLWRHRRGIKFCGRFDALSDFMRWDCVGGIDLGWGWHNTVIAQQLEDVNSGKVKSLLVNVPRRK